MSELMNRIDNFIDNEPDNVVESILDFMSLIDMDSLNEEQIEKIDEIFDCIESNEMLSEKMERVVRGGKKVKKQVCKSGYKVVDGKCVKIGIKERLSRIKGAIKAAKKKKGQSAAIAKKRAKSMKKR